MSDNIDGWDEHWISPKIEQRTLREIQRTHIIKVCSQCHGNLTMAAKVLGISRAGLNILLRKHEIKVPVFRKNPPWRDGV